MNANTGKVTRLMVAAGALHDATLRDVGPREKYGLQMDLRNALAAISPAEAERADKASE